MNFVAKILESIEALLNKLKEGQAADILGIIKDAFAAIGKKD